MTSPDVSPALLAMAQRAALPITVRCDEHGQIGARIHDAVITGSNIEGMVGFRTTDPVHAHGSYRLLVETLSNPGAIPPSPGRAGCSGLSPDISEAS